MPTPVQTGTVHSRTQAHSGDSRSDSKVPRMPHKRRDRAPNKGLRVPKVREPVRARGRAALDRPGDVDRARAEDLRGPRRGRRVVLPR